MTRKAIVRVLVGGATVFGLTSAAIAHHSFAAQYDSTQLMTLEGVVTKVEWMNPHTFFHIDVADENGQVTNWAVEGGAPNVLYRRGWKPDSLQSGDEVKITGHRARDGSALVRGLTFAMADGRCLFNGQAGAEGAPTAQVCE